MVLGKRAATGKMTSAKRTYSGANRYTPYRLPRRGFYGRRGYYKKGYNQQLKEIKYQTVRTSLEIDATGFLGGVSPATGILLNGTTVGADVKQRVGRRITMKSVQLRMTLTSTNFPINEYYSTSARVMLIYDRNPNGVVGPPTFNDYLDIAMNTTSPTGVPHYINAGKNLDNKDRFIFLLDKVYTVQQNYGMVPVLPPITPADSNHLTMPQVNKQFYINLKNLNVGYNGTGGTLSNISEGALYLVAFTNKSSAGFSDNIHIECGTRVRYTDM